jgi:hypothetical protein
VEELGESSGEEEDPAEYCVGGYHPVSIGDLLDDRLSAPVHMFHDYMARVATGLCIQSKPIIYSVLTL